jgi:hypothetical protein
MQVGIEFQNRIQSPDVIPMGVGYKQEIEARRLQSERPHILEQKASIAASIEKQSYTGTLNQAGETPETVQAGIARHVIEQQGQF